MHGVALSQILGGAATAAAPLVGANTTGRRARTAGEDVPLNVVGNGKRSYGTIWSGSHQAGMLHGWTEHQVREGVPVRSMKLFLQVGPGDTLAGLAVKYDSSPAELARMNGMSVAGNDLFEGKVLKVPKRRGEETGNTAREERLKSSPPSSLSQEKNADFFAHFDAQFARNAQQSRENARRLNDDKYWLRWITHLTVGTFSSSSGSINGLDEFPLTSSREHSSSSSGASETLTLLRTGVAKCTYKI